MSIRHAPTRPVPARPVPALTNPCRSSPLTSAPAVVRAAPAALLFLFAILLAPEIIGTPAHAAPTRLDGPVPAEVDRVIDGDTLAVRAQIWLGLEITLRVRIRGIDAPELRGRCAAERHLARRARAYLRAATRKGTVILTEISGGKYYGRVIATVTTRQGQDIARALRRARLARPWRGGKRQEWCK